MAFPKVLLSVTKRIILPLLFIFLAAALPAGGKKEKENFIQVSGVIRMVGSGPITELVLSSPEGEWYIAREDASKLREYQQRTVTIKGIETVKEMKFANGQSAGIRRTLSKVELLEYN